MSQSKSKDDYLVAIITALPIERAAVRAMLDEEHRKPFDFEQHREDPNSYTWGRIGQHNIVVTSLPAGVYGTTSATATVLPMKYAFSKIRWGLMVGIAAGIPSEERDIRLGDVVVSQPSGNSGGVFQYDFGKAKYDNNWQRLDWLARPPEILLRALANLQAEHEFMGPFQAQQFFREAVGRHHHWAKQYDVPRGAMDRLFLASHPHQQLSKSCLSCDPKETVKRTERESSDFKIHYGVIASGNTLVKDAQFRDKVAMMVDQCICLEMEAAGLMNDFPCLVIRGICDYADSHKNDIWQRYASATAAAFAKELLGFMPATDSHYDHHVSIPIPSTTDCTMTGSAPSIDQTGHQERPEELAIAPTTSKASSITRKKLSPKKRKLLLDEIEEKLGRVTEFNSPIDKEGNTFLHQACRSGNIEMVEVLLDEGATVDAWNRFWNTPLHLAAKQGQTEVVELLLDRNAEIEAQSLKGWTSMHFAARGGRTKVLKLLLDRNADIEAMNEEGETALYIAARYGQIEAVELLLDRNANIKAKAKNDDTALHSAAFKGRTEVVKLLLDRNANIEAKNEEGETALHIAAFHGNTDTVKLLLDRNANIEAQDRDAETPLYSAARLREVETVKLLLRRGAKPNARNDEGDLPSDIARARGYKDIVQLLTEHGEAPSIPQQSSSTTSDLYPTNEDRKNSRPIKHHGLIFPPCDEDRKNPRRRER